MNINNKPFTSGKIARAITEYKVRSRYPTKWCVSDFRHSFAVNFLSKGGDMKDLQYILGHYNVHLTRQLYGEVTKKTLSKKFENSMDLYTATTP